MSNCEMRDIVMLRYVGIVVRFVSVIVCGVVCQEIILAQKDFPFIRYGVSFNTEARISRKRKYTGLALFDHTCVTRLHWEWLFRSRAKLKIKPWNADSQNFLIGSLEPEHLHRAKSSALSPSLDIHSLSTAWLRHLEADDAAHAHLFRLHASPQTSPFCLIASPSTAPFLSSTLSTSSLQLGIPFTISSARISLKPANASLFPFKY